MFSELFRIGYNSVELRRNSPPTIGRSLSVRGTDWFVGSFTGGGAATGV
jgi:hypothetical protein